jgi:hypothetical protein
MEILEQLLLKETLKIVQLRGAVTATELAVTVAGNLYPTTYSGKDYINYLDTLVKKGVIKEVQYVLPDQLDRIKSVYFPAGTRLEL